MKWLYAFLIGCVLTASLYLAETNIYIEYSVSTVTVSPTPSNQSSAPPSSGVPNHESHGEKLKVVLRRRLDNYLMYDLGLGDFNYALYAILFGAPLIANFWMEEKNKTFEEEIGELI